MSEQGLAVAKKQCDLMSANFDSDWYVKVRVQRTEKNNALRNDCREWQNNDTYLKQLFKEGVDTRQKLKDMYGVW